MVEALDRANAPDATLNTLQRVYGILNRGCAVAPVEVSDLLLLKVEHLGQTLSRRLGVPFISGKTGNVLDTLNQHDTVVMSKVGDAGLSINATRVIEADFLGGRTEIGQRALRTQHAVRLSSRRSRPARRVSHDSDQKGIHHPQPPAIGAVCAGGRRALCGGGSGGVGVSLAETAVAQGVSGVR